MMPWLRHSVDPPVSTLRIEALTDGVFAIAAGRENPDGGVSRS